MFFRVVFDGFRSTTVGVSFAQDRVDCGAHYFAVAGADVFFGIGGRIFRKIGDGVAFGLEFLDGFFELGNRCGNVRELDDVRVGQKRHVPEFGEVIGDLLIHGEKIGKLGDDTAGERDVAGFHVDTGWFSERLNDGEEGIGSESWGFVGLGVDDGIGHSAVRWAVHRGMRGVGQKL